MQLPAPTNDDDTLQLRAATRSSEPSIIRSFGIRGLYGYRNISLESEFAATVLIARNGSGKTTLLGALDAFLQLQFSRLGTIEFDEIRCEIRGIDAPLVLLSSEIREITRFEPTSQIINLAQFGDTTPILAFDFVFSDYRQKFRDVIETGEAGLAYNIMSKFSFDVGRANKYCEDIYLDIIQRSPNIFYIHKTIRSALNGYEIVYLPTYRRVELALKEDKKSRTRGRRSRSKFNISPAGLHTGDIQFGLLDISERLENINQELISASNSGYREISGNIINELINGYPVDENAPLPEEADLQLFLSRLESVNRKFGPYGVTAPDFSRIYSGEGVTPESLKFLRYFLNKLLGVIELGKSLEKPVRDFVSGCNRYLASSEPSTQIMGEVPHSRLSSFDGKALRMDPKDLSVDVESLPALRPIPLDALSSGEKQMISLFAKLYLYPNKKIVLIDEPELSLSIDWQRGILLDVVLAPLCNQVIAITHSPFIFDNALEPFARSMKLQIDREKQAKIFAVAAEESIGE